MVLLNNLENDVTRMIEKCKKYKQAKKFLNRITQDWGDWYVEGGEGGYRAILTDCDRDEHLLWMQDSTKKKAVKRLANELLKTIANGLAVEI